MGRFGRPALAGRATVLAAALAGLATVLAAAIAVAAAPAATHLPVFPIPGLGGRELSVAGVARLDDGGALIAASTSAGGHARWRLAMTRLRVDGTVALGYGDAGISSPAAGRGARATALAIDPGTGSAWVGAVTRSGGGEIIALGARGDRRRGFGSGGVVRLPARLAGAPVALAWRPGELIVAGGSQPCAGCELAVLNPASGTITSSGPLAPVAPAASTSTPTASRLAQGAACAAQGVTSAAIEAHAILIATRAGTTPGCDAQVRVLRDRAAGLTSAASFAIAGAGSAQLQAAGRQVCLAASFSGQTRLGSLAPGGAPGPLAREPAGRVVALAPLGAGACGALLTPAGGRRAIVVQATAGTQRSSSDLLPARVQPLGMSRCNHHLLVIGARAAGRSRAALVAVVPLRRGPHAQAGAVASVASAAGRCSR